MIRSHDRSRDRISSDAASRPPPHAWVYTSTGSVALSVLLHGWANVTNAVAVSVMASPLVPLATAGVTWLFVAWLLRRYGGATLRAPG